MHLVHSIDIGPSGGGMFKVQLSPHSLICQNDMQAVEWGVHAKDFVTHYGFSSDAFV